MLDFFGWRGPPDAIITSGSHNVHIMDLPAARAAGTVDHDYLNTPIPAESFADKAKAFAINTAVTILEVAQFTRCTRLIIWRREPTRLPAAAGRA